MSHQGNIYLSYNLALVVQVLQPSFREDNELKQLIIEEAIKHLQIRFNKQAKDERENKINEFFKERVSVNWIDSNDGGKWTTKITNRDFNKIGKVYLFLFKGNSERDTEIFKSIEEKLHSVDSEMRVEFFNIDFPSKMAKADKKSEALYHLTSRVCTAFVEYIPFLRDNTPDDRSAIRVIDIIAPIHGVLKEEEVIKKILDVRDAVDLICEGLDGSMQYFPPVSKSMRSIFEGKANEDKSVWVRYKFPFGVWFRGQSRICYTLKPSLFREIEQPRLHKGCTKFQPPSVMYDETSMVYHFMLTKPEFGREYKDLFEWLCLMQHYNTPSRLLDWTENMLMALYFAVNETNIDCDGAVWVLNAGRLNEITRASESRRYACFPNSIDVVLRSAMADSRTGKELKTTLIKQNHMDQVRNNITEKKFFDWLDGKCSGDESKVWNQLAYPVAVYPSRANDRLANQQAAFTLHGGKSYDPKILGIPKEQMFPHSIGLIELSKEIKAENTNPNVKNLNNKKKQFLEIYLVPSCAKRKLREQLKRLGVHIASVFPELEYQAQYVKHQWRFEPGT